MRPGEACIPAARPRLHNFSVPASNSVTRRRTLARTVASGRPHGGRRSAGLRLAVSRPPAFEPPPQRRLRFTGWSIQRSRGKNWRMMKAFSHVGQRSAVKPTFPMIDVHAGVDDGPAHFDLQDSQTSGFEAPTTAGHETPEGVHFGNLIERQPDGFHIGSNAQGPPCAPQSARVDEERFSFKRSRSSHHDTNSIMHT
jgi:hypothetical protein